MSLKILCIDATILRDDRLTGVERYIIELIKAFGKIENEFKIYVLLNKRYTKFRSQINFGDPIYSPTTYRIINDQIWIPYITLKLKADLVHFPVFGAPVFCQTPAVLTIHDATPWKFPETISKGMRLYYKPLYKQSVKRAKHIITVSNSSKNDLIAALNIPTNKITTIYEAVDRDFFNIDNLHHLSPLDLNLKYLLSVGTLEPRKNVKILLEAYAILKSKYKIPHKLVFTGRKGWIDNLKVDESLKEDIIFTGFIPDENLPSVYNNAAVYVFPSLYEGFGFPILEAFALKVPVVSSDTSSLPEIGGNGCLYANSGSAAEFAEQIYSILKDNGLRNMLVDNGNKILQNFSWTKCGLETLQVYRNILN